MASYDIIGNIAIVKFDWNDGLKKKKEIASRILKTYNSVSTVLEKSDKFSGRLRTLKTKYIAGEKTKEALYRENGCVFRLNVDSCYFSPRLSSERKDIASKVKKGEHVLVMFSGVGPFPIAIGKLSKAAKVVSVELGRECSKYALENVKRNKLQGKVEVVQGDVRRVIPRMKGQKFDRIVMARPNLKDSFLDVAFPKIKKGGIIHYYGFYNMGEVDKLKELIFDEARNAKKKVKILGIKKAGDIGPYKYRYRADLKILN